MDSALIDDVLALMDRDARARSAWSSRRAGDFSSHFKAIRALYALRDPRAEYDPYFCDIAIPLTPIERSVWADLRTLDLSFYPQYPVGRYFADFADPVRKVAIECDGKQWHNAARDAIRDKAFVALGWRVIRIEGWRCHLADNNPASSYQLIKALLA